MRRKTERLMKGLTNTRNCILEISCYPIRNTGCITRKYLPSHMYSYSQFPKTSVRSVSMPSEFWCKTRLPSRGTKPEDAIPNCQRIDLSCLSLTCFFDRMTVEIVEILKQLSQLRRLHHRGPWLCSSQRCPSLWCSPTCWCLWGLQHFW
jgi:hypothetical protein